MRGAEEARRNYPTSKVLKVCIVGPKCSGKTALARALAGAPWESGRRYTPTVGVRIQELSINKNTTLELWDCSGDARYEAYHPAVASNAEGVILVYTLFQPKQKLELEKWYHDFAAANHLPASVCPIIGVDTGVNNSKASAMEGRIAALPHMVLVLKNPEANAQLLHVLDDLLQNILKRKRSQE
ncbi:FAP9, ras family GTPase-like protein [Selaginella moellendorffii]|uniref:FAP9, ras family GTPase-like protein n=1 Tax=Selaginella moellendorffii TaxID=88036 RepID=D8RBK9_SELML|nr:intraflagellar transport protein 22 [Selaginella moellendorffii]EFJ30815.1 FAP9, ras family GTPase-like protein [Selaginella moellendorffii]|eukprot:XP_002968561.1 intraflagellar transport protein 22 [Selaginella moellendorffii]